MPDLVGTGLLGGGIGAITLGVTQGPQWGWSDFRTAVLLGGGVVATALALWRSRRHPAPAVETSLWRSRTFAVANVGSFLYGLALYPWLLIGVLFVTQVWHYSELKAGLAVSPGAVTATMAALTLGRIGGRVGPRAAVTGGGAVMTISGFWFLLNLHASPEFLTLWLPASLLGGAGMGAVTFGTASAAALSVSPIRFAGATGLNTTARQIGGAFGVAALAAIMPVQAAPHDFQHVYLFCSVGSVAVALAGLGLSSPARPMTTERADTADQAREGVRV